MNLHACAHAPALNAHTHAFCTCAPPELTPPDAAVVQGWDEENPDALVLKFDDKSTYWFPAKDVQQWIVDAPPTSPRTRGVAARGAPAGAPTPTKRAAASPARTHVSPKQATSPPASPKGRAATPSRRRGAAAAAAEDATPAATPISPRTLRRRPAAEAAAAAAAGRSEPPATPISPRRAAAQHQGAAAAAAAEGQQQKQQQQEAVQAQVEQGAGSEVVILLVVLVLFVCLFGASVWVALKVPELRTLFEEVMARGKV